ncbi:MAG: Uma2 family endonuclease [Chloroflexota bacterium]
MTTQTNRTASIGRDDLCDPRTAPDYLPPPPAPVAWEDFLDWLDEDVHAEWVDGEIVEMSPATDEHQRLAGFLYILLTLFVQRHGLGEVFQAPFRMRLPSRPSGREPDVLFINDAHADRVTHTFVNGPADLVIEVVSPESVSRDLGEKLAEYEHAGVPEYWVVDPLHGDERFYQLGDDGRYRMGVVDEDGIYTSRAVPGFRLRVAWLRQRPLPTVDAALAELAG